MSPSEQHKAEPGHINRITEEIARARFRHRMMFLLGGCGLLVVLLLVLTLIGFSNGTAIEVKPDDAQQGVRLELVGGLGMTIGNAVYSISSNPTIEVAADGFRPLRKTLQASEIGGIVPVELAELPGRLSVTTSPSAKNTHWYIDGHLVKVVEQLQYELPAGSYELLIDSPYYQKQNIQVVMQRDKVFALAVDLEAVSGQLKLNSIPAGATVRINGDEAGETPLLLAKAGGNYRVELRLGDYKPVHEEIEVSNRESLIEREYRLELRDASLHLQLSPPGGRLLLDGKVIEANGPVAVKAGVTHLLSYHKEGYFSKRRSISASAGSEKKLSFNLKPEFGKVSIHATPVATVKLDGKVVGKTPFESSLPARTHRLELIRSGYRTHQQMITPSSKSARLLRVKLLTRKQAKLAEARATYLNQGGVKLRLFKPADTFVMGAPRHEKGQRANEFLRTVKLTKPFYISLTEISREQFGRFRQASGRGNEPVTQLSWMDAALYCNWLSGLERKLPFYRIRNGRLQGVNADSDGYRLPTEAEWEWLARKAGRGKQTRFTWGDETTIPSGSGNIADEFAKGKTVYYVPGYTDSYAGVAPVGSYPPEKSGLYDLSGNVSEWVHDAYRLTAFGGRKQELDPLDSAGGDSHVVKGSNWRSGRITELRAAYREGENAGRDDIGFRVARYLYGGADEQ